MHGSLGYAHRRARSDDWHPMREEIGHDERKVPGEQGGDEPMTTRGFPDANQREMTVRGAASYLAEPESAAVLIDVREPDEYLPRHARGAVNIPMSEFVARIAEVPQDKDALVICEHGTRSASVVKYLLRQGYTRAFNVDGGTEMWEAAGLPMEYPT